MVRLESSVAPRILTLSESWMSVPATLHDFRPEKDLNLLGVPNRMALYKSFTYLLTYLLSRLDNEWGALSSCWTLRPTTSTSTSKYIKKKKFILLAANMAKKNIIIFTSVEVNRRRRNADGILSLLNARSVKLRLHWAINVGSRLITHCVLWLTLKHDLLANVHVGLKWMQVREYCVL